MKKIVLSTIAATALLFGITSCSGDLHENAIQPLCITGLCGTEVVPMNLDSADGSEQSLTFTVKEDSVIKGLDGKDKALKDGWGGLSSIQFKIVPSTELKENREPNWKVDWGGATDSGNIFVKPGADEYTALLMRGDPGTTAAGPSNVQIDGAAMNEEYTIRVKYSGNKVSVKIDGFSEDPTEMKINIVGDSKNFPAKDENGKDLTYKMSKAGKVYTYQFISVADETLEFNLSNPMCGTFYASSTKDGELELESAGKKNLSYDVKKNFEYKITVDLSKSVIKPTINVEIVSLLKNAAVSADWIYDNDPYEKDAKSDNPNNGVASVVFQYTQKNLEFIVQRIKGDNKLAWGGKDIVITTTDDKEYTELSYYDDGKAEPVTFKGLTENNFYLLQVKNEAGSFKLSTRVLNAPVEETVYLIGGFGSAAIYKADGETKTDESDIGWGTPAHKVELTDGKATVIYTYNGDGWGGSDGELNFKFLNNLEEKLEYCGGEDDVGKECSLILAGSGNFKMKNLVKGKKYKITIESIPAYIKVTFEEVK